MTTRLLLTNVNGNTRPVDGDNMEHFKRKAKSTEQAISRLTLGEIGNRVSAITIDTSKGGAIKKEILQPADGILTRARSAKLALPSSMVTVKQDGGHQHDTKVYSKATKAETDLAPVKVEWMPDHNHLPNVPRVADVDIGLFDVMSHNSAPMDVSDDGTDAFSKAMFNEQIEDIDAEDSENPQLVSLYVNNIYTYMRQLEKKYSIKPNMLDGTDITGKMRAILVDWLCQVHNRFHLLQETLYLTVAIIDRYLQVKPCTRNRLQLVGVTAMLVASKYEEMYAPEVADFVYITDNAYSKQDVRDMEQDILRTLDFSFGRPLCLHFLRRNSKAGQVDASKHTLAKYLLELAMIEYDMVHIRPSHLAAAALYLAMVVLDGSKWTHTLHYYSSYSENDLHPLAKKLAQLVVKAETNKLTAVKTKYSSSKFMKIAVIPQLKSKTILELASSDAS
ncbi:G2/mitotic-specific cyclin-B-like [Physella acuta]|uniref:G2/mitotic-specific cyclin-B-like n=1 Tax=Physella acuta TaxID=109671 RepID=UPI0027DB467E|nr:G2/mitotic-specific cyclin-B-like [Physella acuta]